MPPFSCDPPYLPGALSQLIQPVEECLTYLADGRSPIRSTDIGNLMDGKWRLAFTTDQRSLALPVGTCVTFDFAVSTIWVAWSRAVITWWGDKAPPDWGLTTAMAAITNMMTDATTTPPSHHSKRRRCHCQTHCPLPLLPPPPSPLPLPYAHCHYCNHRLVKTICAHATPVHPHRTSTTTIAIAKSPPPCHAIPLCHHHQRSGPSCGELVQTLLFSDILVRLAACMRSPAKGVPVAPASAVTAPPQLERLPMLLPSSPSPPPPGLELSFRRCSI